MWRIVSAWYQNIFHEKKTKNRFCTMSLTQIKKGCFKFACLDLTNKSESSVDGQFRGTVFSWSSGRISNARMDFQQEESVVISSWPSGNFSWNNFKIFCSYLIVKFSIVTDFGNVWIKSCWNFKNFCIILSYTY